MAITNKLITFNKLTSFETQLAQGNILETSIVFIKDAKKIWTKGTYFDCSGGGSSNIAVYETTDDVYNGVLNSNAELMGLLINSNSYTLIIVQKTTTQLDKNVFIFNVCKSPMVGYKSYNCIFTDANKYGAIRNPICYQIEVNLEVSTFSLTKQDLALKSDIPNTDNFLPAEKNGDEYNITDGLAIKGGLRFLDIYGNETASIGSQSGVIDATEISGKIVTSNIMLTDDELHIDDKYGDSALSLTYKGDGTKFLSDDGSYKTPSVDTSNLATQANLTSAVTQLTTNIAKKQDKLVSGTNIKTINNTSLLGSGNIAIKDTKNLTYSLNNSTSGTVTLQPNACIYMPNVLTGKLAINACATISSNNNELIESRICFRMPNNASLPVIQFNGVAIRWAGGNAPTFEADFTYEVSLFYPSNANSVGPMGVCVGFK